MSLGDLILRQFCPAGKHLTVASQESSCGRCYELSATHGMGQEDRARLTFCLAGWELKDNLTVENKESLLRTGIQDQWTENEDLQTGSQDQWAGSQGQWIGNQDQ